MSKHKHDYVLFATERYRDEDMNESLLEFYKCECGAGKRIPYLSTLVSVERYDAPSAPSLPDSAPDDVLGERILKEVQDAVNRCADCKYDDADYSDIEGIMSLIRAAIQSALPEKLEKSKDEIDWFYGQGFNAAISEIEANLKKKGLL